MQDQYRKRHHSRRRYQRTSPQRQMVTHLVRMILPLGLVFLFAFLLISNLTKKASLHRLVSEHENTFLPTVTVGGHSLTGYNKEEAIEYLDSLYLDSLEDTLTISYGSSKWTFSPKDVNAQVDVDQQVEIAWQYGKNGSDEERRDVILALEQNPIDLPVTLTYDEEALERFVQSVKMSVDVSPVDATITLNGSEKPVITASSTGLDLDASVLRGQLEQVIRQGKGEEITLAPTVLMPNVQTQDVSSEFILLAECTTSLEGSSSARNGNVALALSHFNGLIMQPEETFSFNKIVGDRTTKNGFKEANEYDGTTVVKGIGGGVCQAATTLYGAVLRVPLQIVERSNHKMRVNYVPASQDAAVSYPDKDLVFKNTIGVPLYFFTEVNTKKKTATVRIYGKALAVDYRVEIRSEVLQEDIKSTSKTYIDDTEGKQAWFTDQTVFYKAGTPGRKSRAYRQYISLTTGEVIHEELLSDDYYYPGSDTYLRGIHTR